MAIYDIAIIGSGPCGSVLAMLLAKQGFKVVIIDKRNMENWPPKRGKACGGLLSPDAQRILACLDLDLPNEILVNPQLFSVKTMDLKLKKERYYQRFYMNMDRERFDRYLVSLVPDSVLKKYSTLVKDITYSKDVYSIHTDLSGILNAKVLIGCDGADSIVRKKFFALNKMHVKRYYAIQHVYKCDKKSSKYYALFDKDLTDYSGWAFPKDETFTVGMAFSDKLKGNVLFERLICKLEEQGINLGQPIKKEGSFLLRPCGLSKVFVKNDNTVFLAGEAAGYISPSSAEGFSFALDSACSLATAFQKAGDIRRNYARYTKKMRIKIFSKVLKASLMYNQSVRRIIMALKINAIR